MDSPKPLWTMPFSEFLHQPLDRWAEVLIASVAAGRSACWPAYHQARAWIQEWRGKYETPEAREAALGVNGRGWVFAVEWSNRTWRTEIKRALERGEKVPAEVLKEAGITP